MPPAGSNCSSLPREGNSCRDIGDGVGAEMKTRFWLGIAMLMDVLRKQGGLIFSDRWCERNRGSRDMVMTCFDNDCWWWGEVALRGMRVINVSVRYLETEGWVWSLENRKLVDDFWRTAHHCLDSEFTHFYLLSFANNLDHEIVYFFNVWLWEEFLEICLILRPRIYRIVFVLIASCI